MKEPLSVEALLAYALAEDIGSGDHTSLSTISSNQKGAAQLLVKQEGVLSGMSISKKIFDLVDSSLEVTEHMGDGDKIRLGDVAFIVRGSTLSILKAERLVLNFLQRMSGIATTTSNYVSKIKGLNSKILDTRKTTPLLRAFEKEAVVHGGGYNHRFGLYDMILIKDNHVDFAGGINNAINSSLQYLAQNKLDLKIEIEVRNFNELKQVLENGRVHRIMLDNFSTDLLSQAIKMIGGRFETEASGGINLETVRSFAETGVDFISVGALTHQIKSLDLSLKAC
jgi:nicotinate-nucleotide pyrophosphorylase (carboxylating)